MLRITDFHEVGLLIDVAERLGLEVGVPFRWVYGGAQTPIAWSAKLEDRTILHLRRGKATLRTQIGNMIKCEEEAPKLHNEQRPVEVIRFLVDAATLEGDRVLELAGGVGSTNIACQRLRRHCVAIEQDLKQFQAGKERLAAFSSSHNFEEVAA